MQATKTAEVIVVSIGSEKIVAEARKAMRRLKTYKKDFEPILQVYGQLYDQYTVLTQQYTASGYKYDADSAASAGSKKAPIVATLEGLRRDILAYATQLGLTPHGLPRAKTSTVSKAKNSPLAALLREADKL